MVIAIIAVLAVSGTYLFSFLIQSSTFIPNQLNSNMLASDALNIIIEGDSQAKGLRFSRVITALADYQVNFINQDNQSIVYRMDTGTNKLYRSINGAAEELIPYYANANFSLIGKNNKLFTYYDSTEAITNNPANVRLMTLALIAQTGTGAFANWEGQNEQATAIAVDRYQ